MGTPGSPGIALQGVLVKAATTIDGGWRITFDVSADEGRAVLQLSALRGALLQLGIVAIDGLEPDLSDLEGL